MFVVLPPPPVVARQGKVAADDDETKAMESSTLSISAFLNVVATNDE
jgi:hypothetical protein